VRFDKTNWYWCVGGDQTKFWSSAKPGYVTPTDPGYVAFLANGGTASPIASLAELQEAFANQFPAGSLQTYAAAKRYAKEVGGTTISGVAYPTDRATQAKLTSAALMAQINSTVTFNWKTADGSFVSLNAQGLLAVATAIGTFVQGCFSVESTVLGGINGGTITTLAQVDAAFA
jgi:hypothetical protein